MKKIKIVVVIHSHRHGIDTYLCKSNKSEKEIAKQLKIPFEEERGEFLEFAYFDKIKTI